jgi:hypothetical protein
MAHELKLVDHDFFDRAPLRFVFTEAVHHPADRVFDAVASRPADWGKWFPGFSNNGRYLSDPPYGVGSEREVKMAGIRFRETVLAWDAPVRWAFSVTEAGLPVAQRLAEDYRISSHGPYSLVQWTFAADPPPRMSRLMPLGRPLMRSLFRRAMTNLSVMLSETEPTGT